MRDAARHVAKATLVPLRLEPARPRKKIADFGPERAIVKQAYVRQLGLQAGEVKAVRQRLKDLADKGSPDMQLARKSHDLWNLPLLPFENTLLPSLLPPSSAFAPVPVAALQTFGEHLLAVRMQVLGEAERAGPTTQGALVPLDTPELQDLVVSSGRAEHLYAVHVALMANRGLTMNTASSDMMGMLNLERLEMTPAGIQRGELVATVPLAPQEETAVTHKEWSVTAKEFTSIVTDALENFSETGVTDNTELAQSVVSQVQHANQLNITGTVSGGIPMISGSTSTSFTAQD